MPTEFENQCLVAHNQKRREHGAPPLKLNSGLSAKAQEWAEYLKSTRSFSHRTDRNFQGQIMGENIAWKSDSRCTDFTGDQPTQMWYDEIKDYNFGSHQSYGVTGHFTQVVWKGSTELGVGRATDGRGTWYVVANYLPAGNMVGSHPQNVFPRGTPAPPVSDDDQPCDLESNIGQMAVQEKKTCQEEKQVVGTNKSTRTKTSTINGKTTKTKITEITYTYSDGSTSKETNEEVDEY